MLNSYYGPGQLAGCSEKVIWPTALFLNSKHLFLYDMPQCTDYAIYNVFIVHKIL